MCPMCRTAAVDASETRPVALARSEAPVIKELIASSLSSPNRKLPRAGDEQGDDDLSIPEAASRPRVPQAAAAMNPIQSQMFGRGMPPSGENSNHSICRA
jgi:hypothetical protein